MKSRKSLHGNSSGERLHLVQLAFGGHRHRELAVQSGHCCHRQWPFPGDFWPEEGERWFLWCFKRAPAVSHLGRVCYCWAASLHCLLHCVLTLYRFYECARSWVQLGTHALTFNLFAQKSGWVTPLVTGGAVRSALCSTSHCTFSLIILIVIGRPIWECTTLLKRVKKWKLSSFKWSLFNKVASRSFFAFSSSATTNKSVIET